MSAPILHQPALILHRSPWSESSFILRCLVSEYGIVSVLAKGARRPRSPFAGCLEPLSFVELGFSYRVGREMQTLTEVHVLERFESLWGHLHAQSLALSFVELLLALRIDGAHSSGVLLDFLKALRYINQNPIRALQKEGLLSLRLLARLCAHEGFALQLQNCAQCGCGLDEHSVALLQKAEGAFLCQSCALCSPEASVQSLWVALGAEPVQSPYWPHAEQLLLDYLCSHMPQVPLLKAREILLALRESL